MAGAFAAAVSSWASQTKERMEAVRTRAITLLGEDMALTRPQGGRVPFKTGNLARSLEASAQGMPKTSETPSVGGDVGLIVALAGPTKPIWLGYTAIYARRMNYGFVGADKLGRVYNQQGAYFVESAIQKWPQLVAQAAKEVQSEAEG